VILRFILAILLLVSGSLTAQESGYLDLVNLKNGQKLEGIITHYEPGELLTIRLRNGKETTLTMSEVKRIGFTSLGKEKLEQPTVKVNKEIQDYSKKFTSHPYIGANFSMETNDQNGFFSPRRNVIAGYIISFVEAYNFSPSFRAGLGGSFNIYNATRKERVASLYGHARLLFAKKMLAPFAQLDAGYGVPIGSKSIPLIERQGGVLIHPSLGFRIAATASQPEISLDLGYRFLSTEYNFASFRGLETRTNQYRRFILRLGTTF
jgi:hypothetical protein